MNQGVLIFLAALTLFVIVQGLIIKFNGEHVAVLNIPRNVQIVGAGPELSYAVMGDSTGVSQGSKYDEGFAFASTRQLGESFSVRAINTAISGATSADVRRDQLDTVAKFKPDIVLLAMGANDATHLLRAKTIRLSTQAIIDELRRVNPEVQIITTGSPAMDSVTRFPDGAKQVMGLRTAQVNAVYEELIKKNNLIHAPIAEGTRDAFIADPTLTAADNFHPNARGYALWIPIINQAIDKAVERR